MAGNLINKILDFMGIAESNEEDHSEHVETPHKPVLEPVVGGNYKKSNVVNIHSSTSPIKVVLIEPSNFDDVQGICDNLKGKKPVIINFENMDKDLAKRMVDFLSGAVYALDGNIQKVSNGIVLVAPSNVDILGNIKNSLGREDFDLEGIFNWLK